MTTLLFAGDTVLKHPTEHTIDSHLKKIIKDHAVASCNFEAPLSGTGSPLPKIGPAISQPAAAIDTLTEAGFNLFTLGNNHMMDYGRQGLEATLTALDQTPHIGAGLSEAATYQIFTTTINGTTFGIMSIAEWGFGAHDTEQTCGFAWINHPSVPARIKAARALVDVLIVQVHAGVEDIGVPLPEWRECYRHLIEAGVDVVIGHHSHIVQGVEAYQDGHIFYSLGNFYFEKPQAPLSWRQGVLLSLSFTGAVLTAWRLIPTLAHDTGVTVDDTPERHALIEKNTALLTDTYSEYCNELVRTLWETRYKHFFTRSLGGFTTLRGSVRALLVFLRNPQKTIDYQLLTHNLSIESHRYAATRAIRLLTQK